MLQRNLLTPTRRLTVARKSQKVSTLAIKANIEMVVYQVKSSKSILAELVEKNKLKIIGASYDLDTGRTDIIIP